MGDNRDDIAGLLLALRECPAAPRDTLRRHRIEALAARAARLDGSARQLLDDRLRALIEAELQLKAPTSTSPTSTQDATAAGRPGARALSTLLLRLSRVRNGTATTSHVRAADAVEAETSAANASRLPLQDANGFATLTALDAFRETWSRLRTAGHLQHILADVPEDAGPMHSTVLVHRAIALLQDAAPAYLQHFLGYVDALAGLERISPRQATTPAPRLPRPPPPASPANASRPGKAPRPRSRGRRRPA